MNPYPAKRSVIVLDNCRIHHNEALAELVAAAGGSASLVLYPSGRLTFQRLSYPLPSSLFSRFEPNRGIIQHA